MEHHHRSGPLKQQNKNFKAGKHDSKGAVKRRAAGKIERTNIKNLAVVPSRHDLIKNKQQQLSQSKKQEQLERRRLGLPDLLAPRIVTLVYLSETIDKSKVKSLLLTPKSQQAGSMDTTEDFSHITSPSIPNPLFQTMSIGSKTRMTLLECPSMEYNQILEYCSLADIILFVVDANQTEKSDVIEKIFTMVKAQSLPTVMELIFNFSSVPPKKKSEVKKLHQTFFHFHFPDEPKVLPIDTPEESSQVIRYLESSHLNDLLWRKQRPFLLIESSKQIDNNTTVIEGFLRGNNLNSKQILNIPELGDFQIDKIEEIKDPHIIRKRYAFSTQSSMQEDDSCKVLEQSPLDEKDTLQTFNIPNELENEQSLPTKEELATARENKKKLLVPKGTSAYQASWYLDENEEYGEDDEDEDGDQEMGGFGNENNEMVDDDQEDQEMEDEEEEVEEEQPEELEEIVDDTQSKWKEFRHKHEVTAEVLKEMEKLELEGEKEESEDEEDDEMNGRKKISMDEEARRAHELEETLYPDEVDTPGNMPARIRFSRYRGLKSFRTSPWNVKENLPIDYAKIFQFHSFNQSMRYSMKLSEQSPAKPGMYIRIYLKSVPKQLETMCQQKPMVAVGLFKYENKISVLHFSIEKHRTYEDTVKSKETVYFRFGFRKFECQPIYSVSAPNCDKQKFEKYLFPGRNSIATIYGPITFPPAPLMIFKDKECSQLIATGYLSSVNPDRIICKRIILTGEIAKSISKKFVTVRDMFYYTEDIQWFKKVELYTKLGRMGHIKESLGTHGRMKCLFDGTMNQQDTICMNLYKRVFPKWIKDGSVLLK
ncbi:hypothetical protein DLAC_09296 [Tieghemostelium lacteum]|uniref:Bms1-type G domain-containing protein n=1 Tax=Tieghemostelium lacteum TaxID=361077 RepID=A0A151Z9P5_TIELA|nr:hypothetical protein DLAC_09296 [Tieghemostelium lacteum]|eukprot:KYQ90662.1 hypothetical protein DLAC_09296 [Tieghemostelium lacteum]